MFDLSAMKFNSITPHICTTSRTDTPSNRCRVNHVKISRLWCHYQKILVEHRLLYPELFKSYFFFAAYDATAYFFHVKIHAKGHIDLPSKRWKMLHKMIRTEKLYGFLYKSFSVASLLNHLPLISYLHYVPHGPLNTKSTTQQSVLLITLELSQPFRSSPSLSFYVISIKFCSHCTFFFLTIYFIKLKVVFFRRVERVNYGCTVQW